MSNSSVSSDDNGNRRPGSYRKASAADLLDSNGETDDEEIEKLHKTIHDQTKALTEEKQNALKWKQLVKALKRENKQLQQNQPEKKEASQQSISEGGGENSPPWERRKSAVKLVELARLVREKDLQLEQLLADCSCLRKEKEGYGNDIELVTRQFDQCSQQLQTAIEDISCLRTTNQERVAHLTEENEKLRFQLGDCLVQNERNEQNLDKISNAVEFTINRCKEIIASKEKKIEELESKLESYRNSGDLATKDEEIERLRSELISAAEDMEENAVFLEQFQSLSAVDQHNAGSLNKKLERIDSLKAQLQENELQLTERDRQVTDLKRIVLRYEAGTYGLSEATRELRDTKDQLTIRDEHIATLIQQLNLMELRNGSESPAERREKSKKGKSQESPKETAANEQLQRLKEDNKRLNLEVLSQTQNVKRLLKKKVSEKVAKIDATVQTAPTALTAPTAPTALNVPAVAITENRQLQEEYEKARKEALLLRQGLVEILQSVRQHDGLSDVKIESPVLERIVTVLNSERLFGHYDAYADIMDQFSCVQGENKVLREQLRHYRNQHKNQLGNEPNNERLRIEKAVQAMAQCVDCATDPVFVHIQPPSHPDPVSSPVPPIVVKEDVTVSKAMARQVDAYQGKLSDLEQELRQVKLELEQLYDKCHAESSSWLQQRMEWTQEMKEKDKHLKVLEKDLQMKETALETLTSTLEDDRNVDNNPADSVDVLDPEEEKIRMEKEIVTLKIRVQHKEQTLKRFQQFVEEIRLEQLAMIDQHSREQLNLQETILEQQRTLHRVEQTQREMAASAASNRAVLRHLEKQVESNQQLQAEATQLGQQLETLHQQAAQWKMAVELLNQEKIHLKQTLKEEEQSATNQLKSQLATNQHELQSSREAAARLQQQLEQERSEQQRCSLLHVLVAKLRTELDKKEKQVEFIRQLAQEMNARFRPMVAEVVDDVTNPSDDVTKLQLINDELNRKLNISAKEMKSLNVQLEEAAALTSKLQSEKTSLQRQMGSLRNRLTRWTSEKASLSHSVVADDDNRLLKRIKQLETELAHFHTAEKPNEEAQVKSQVMDQWKERKKQQAVIENLKVKQKELQDQVQEDERLKDNLKKTVNRLVNEKRMLEDKLKLKANDNERIHRLIEENTQWRIRFEQLENHVRELTEEAVSTDRHRLQITVLQERIVKQEHQINELQLSKTTSSTSSVDVVKLKECIQRLVTLVQPAANRSNAEKRVTIQEGPSMTDIRRTVNSLNQLINHSNSSSSL